jgi:phosphoglycolate phosphatase
MIHFKKHLTSWLNQKDSISVSKNYKLVIFDWDGTLMDSVTKIVTSMQATAKVLGYTPPTFEQGKSIIGLSLGKGIQTLFPECTPELCVAIEKEYKHQFIEVNNTPTPMFDNALELLSKLKEDNKIVTIATGKARPGLERVLEISKAGHLFDSTRSASDCKSKPHPEMILSLLSEFDVDPSEAVMIGDTSFDLEMAQRANIDAIGVTLGAHERSVLSQYNPIAIVDSLFELEPLLL